MGDGDDERRSGPPSLRGPLSVRATIPPPTPRVTQGTQPPPTPRVVQPRPTLPPPPSSQRDGAMRGATNVIRRCLRVVPGERVHLVTYRAGPLYELFARAVEAAGAVPVRVDLDALAAEALAAPAIEARLAPLLAGATATILIAPERPSATVSVAVAQTAEAQKARHLHLLQVDERVLAQSLRADPEILATVNTRLAAALQPPCQIRVTSEAGTDLEVRLAMGYPILSSNGRPAPGASENLPAGLVYTHQARISGTLVADRAIFGPGLAVDRGALRRAPVRMRFNGARVADFDAPDPAIARTIEAYLASHADAGRVGMLVFPTNYLVRSDVGIDRQDMLLPSMNVSLGYASAATTRATYEAPVQMILLGRRQTIEVGHRKLVDAGRLHEALVDGIDPFR